MTQNHRIAASSLAIVLAAFASTASAQLTYTGAPLSENFDTLPTITPATAVFSHVVGTQTAIPGLTTWQATKVLGTSTATTSTPNLIADAGSGSSGHLYSYGVANVSERALGALASGSNAMAFGTEIVNGTTGTITAVTISFTSEFWRSSTTAQNRLVFSYGVGGGLVTSSNFLTQTGLTPVSLLDVVGPAPVSSNGALDGNISANQAAVSFTINGLTIPAGASLFIRWVDANDGGNDAGLAIDNLSISATVSNGVDVSRGAATIFTPTSFGGNAFTADDNAVFDGTAATVNLSGAVVATSLKFTTDGYILTGSSGDSIAPSGAISVSENVSATISGILAGGVGLTKIGNGTLTLSGNNTFVGNISVSAGILAVSSDSALGAASNDIVLGSILSLPANIVFGAGRDLTGSGTIKTLAGGNLTLAGSLAADSLVFDGLSTLNLAGVTNSVGGLTFAEPVAINVTGGALQVARGNVSFNQTTGTSTITGGFTNTGDRGLFVGGGAVTVTGNVALGGRIIKTGPGTLDLSAATVAGSTPTSGSYRLGIQGSAPTEGGMLRIGSGSALGGLSQVQFNSGTLEIVGSAQAAVGLSIGGRTNSTVSVPTITGGPLTLSGASGYFNAPGGSDGDVLLRVNNTTTLTGAINPTSFTSASPIWVGVGGTGTLVVAGNGERLVDYFIVTDSVTLVIDGTLGGERLLVEADATVSGAGMFSGSSPWEDTNPTSTTNNLTQPATPIWVASTADINGTLAPSGVMTIRASTTMSSGARTVFSIDGAVRGAGYSALVFEVPPASGFNYSLVQNGSVTLDFGAPAINGTYELISAGVGVTRSGGFASVNLAGSHTGSLTKSGSVWSGNSGGTNFSFDEATGVLTVTGGASATTPLQDWRLANFGGIDNSGDAADSADFDGDGITNLIEYATGTNPKVANASPVVVGKNGTGEFLTLSFTRIADPALTYTVVSGSDLVAGLTTVAQTYGGTAADTVVYTDTVSLNTPGVRRFLALRVSYGDN